MDFCLPGRKKVAVVERLLLAEVQLYTYFLPDISL